MSLSKNSKFIFKNTILSFGLLLLNACYYTGTVTILDRQTTSAVYLSPSNTLLSVITGESINFSATGGTGVFKFSDLGTGYINANTGLYTAPLGISPTTDTVSVSDNVGNSVSANIKIRAFETKDSFNLDATMPYDAQSKAIAIDSSGNIYAAGYAKDALNDSHWIVRKSTDGGATWVIKDDYNLSAGKDAYAYAITTDSSGNVYAAGYANDASYIYHWIVRKSTDDGVNWSTVSDYNLSAGDYAKALAITTDSSGNIYAAGYASDASSIYHWIVRKSTDDGVNWSTVSDYNLFAGEDAYAYAITTDSSGNIYTAGNASDASSVPHWIVRKSTDGGTNWGTVSDYNLSAGKQANARAITTDTSGNIYIAGSASDASNINHWIVRKSTDGGVNWSTVSDYNLSAGKQAYAYAITTDTSGNIYVAGTANDALDIPHWIVRKSSDGGANWNTVNDYNLSAGKYAIANAITTDSGGNIYAVGNGFTSTSSKRWVVRKSSDGGVSWSTVDNYFLVMNMVATATAVVTDTSGHIYVAGFADGALPKAHWIVRKSTDGGANWATVDDYVHTVNKDANPASIGIDSTGNIYVAGRANDSSANAHWIIRKSSNGGANWSTVDDYNLSAGFYSQASSLIIDSSNNIYVAGQAYDNTNISHWLVRKSTDGGANWSTVDNYNLSAGNYAYAEAATSDSSGSIYIAGTGLDATSNERWIVRKSSNGGASWSTVYDEQIGMTSGSLNKDSSGNIYVASTVSDSSGYIHWVVRKSSDRGSTWSTIEDIKGISSYNHANSIVPCLQSQICVAGQLFTDITKAPAFVVRILSP